jgi:cathepsin A (carboxypeptidase C)
MSPLMRACIIYIWASMAAELFMFSELGLNPYDVRRKCDHRIDGPLCYRYIGWIETWTTERANKVALGANPDHDFEACNNVVSRAFMIEGESATLQDCSQS